MSIENLLAQIPGIGDKTAPRYVDLVPTSVRSISGLRKVLCALPKEEFARLPIAAQMDLRYNPLRRIPREIIELIDGEFQKYARGIRYDIGGSYRRGKPTSGDLDIVLSRGNSRGNRMGTWEKFRERVNNGSKYVYIMEPFAGKEDKLTVLLRVPENSGNKRVYVKADIFLTDPEEYVFALLFVTGSGKFNVRMRRVAKIRGYLLNQHGLYKKAGDGSGVIIPVDVKNEKELFTMLGMQYKEPHERTA
jgi:DNA polymerase/3'-5' exonuclease PolX